MINFRSLFLAVFLSFGISVGSSINYTVTHNEKERMANEADDWMDDMPDGIQDRMSDAVNHSLHGFFSEIETFRSNDNSQPPGNYSVTVKDIKGGKYSQIPMRVYSPTKKNKTILPILIYFHGGGWSLGSLSTSDRFCRALASKGNLTVISIDYPLTPEQPYPSAISTGREAVDYIFSHVKDYSGAANMVSLGGDGAGGNIALAVTYDLMSQNNSSEKIRSIVLYYPLLDISKPLNAQSKREFGRGYGFDSRLWEAFVSAYKIETPTGQKDYMQSPGLAPESVLNTLPPALLISAGKDIIILQEQDFATKSPNITYIEFEEALHGFITDGHQNTAFNKAVEITDSFLSTGK